jgi:hypothetical protein
MQGGIHLTNCLILQCNIIKSLHLVIAILMAQESIQRFPSLPGNMVPAIIHRLIILHIHSLVIITTCHHIEVKINNSQILVHVITDITYSVAFVMCVKLICC